MLDKNLLMQLRTDINAALEAVGQKHGVQLRAGNATYTTDVATFKLEVLAMKDGVVVDKYAEEFKKYADMYGFKPEHLGASFDSITRGICTIKGLDLKKRKFPIQAVSKKDGKVYLFPLDFVLRALNGEKR